MSDSKENVDGLKMYGEESATQRDEFLKKHNLNEKGLLVNKLKLILRNLVLTKQKRLNLRSGIIIYYKVY